MLSKKEILKKLSTHKFDTSEYVVLKDGVRRDIRTGRRIDKNSKLTSSFPIKNENIMIFHDIETAPKDRNIILAKFDDKGFCEKIAVCLYMNINFFDIWTGKTFSTATHWAELPELK